jgi:acyl-CoA thioester hydrolase
LDAVWFKHRVRVRYQETDQMGVVYHTNYLNWFEIGRTELVRALGYPYRDLERLGLLLPVVEANLKFKQPARYDDLIGIYTRVAATSPLRISFEVEVRKLEEETDIKSSPFYSGLASERVEQTTGELLVSGQTEHVWVDSNWKPVRIDRQVSELYRVIKDLFQV